MPGNLRRFPSHTDKTSEVDAQNEEAMSAHNSSEVCEPFGNKLRRPTWNYDPGAGFVKKLHRNIPYFLTSSLEAKLPRFVRKFTIFRCELLHKTCSRNGV